MLREYPSSDAAGRPRRPALAGPSRGGRPRSAPGMIRQASPPASRARPRARREFTPPPRGRDVVSRGPVARRDSGGSPDGVAAVRDDVYARCRGGLRPHHDSMSEVSEDVPVRGRCPAAVRLPSLSIGDGFEWARATGAGATVATGGRRAAADARTDAAAAGAPPGGESALDGRAGESPQTAHTSAVPGEAEGEGPREVGGRGHRRRRRGLEDRAGARSSGPPPRRRAGACGREDGRLSSSNSSFVRRRAVELHRDPAVLCLGGRRVDGVAREDRRHLLDGGADGQDLRQRDPGRDGKREVFRGRPAEAGENSIEISWRSGKLLERHAIHVTYEPSR